MLCLEIAMGSFLVHCVMFLWGGLLSNVRLSRIVEGILSIPKGRVQAQLGLLISGLGAFGGGG